MKKILCKHQIKLNKVLLKVQFLIKTLKKSLIMKKIRMKKMFNKILSIPI